MVRHRPIYSRVLNEDPKEVLDWMTPFEIYYGRKSNRIMHPLSGSPSSIRKEYLNKPLSEPSLEQRLQFRSKQKKCRRQAQKANEFCNKRMIRLKSKQNPPSVYPVGEAVLVRVKDQGSRRYRVLTGKIVKRNVRWCSRFPEIPKREKNGSLYRMSQVQHD